MLIKINITSQVLQLNYIDLIMKFFSCFRSKDKNKDNRDKVQPNNLMQPQGKEQLFQIFKQNTVMPLNKNIEQSLEERRIEKFSELMAREPMIYEQIQKLSWNGIPQCIRGKTWKYLLKYISGNKTKSNDILERKRTQYNKIVQTYLPTYDLQKIDNETERKNAKIIEGDIKRTAPQCKYIRNTQIQQLLTRSLYIWHIKHPASGYVQGMNDLVIPYFLTFLSQYYPVDLEQLNKEIQIGLLSNQTLNFIEADIYWCLSKTLETVTSNYVRGFGGIRQAYKNVELLLKQIDPKLYSHFEKQKLDLFCLAFRQISTFLLRMFSIKMGIRLFDTFISYQDEYPTFILYLFVAIFVKFSRNFMSMGLDEMMRFIQDLPTKKWSERDLETIISQAYVYKQLYNFNKEKVIA